MSTVVVMDVADMVEREIEDGASQQDVAQSYALGLKCGGGEVDWPRINRAILGRWKPSGLDRIKKMAWSGKAFA